MAGHARPTPHFCIRVAFMRIPNAEHATVDIRKLRDFCMNPLHPEGKHKARLFAAALGMTDADAEFLRDALLHVAQSTTRRSGGAMPTGNAIKSISYSTGVVGRPSYEVDGSSNTEPIFPSNHLLSPLREERR